VYWALSLEVLHSLADLIGELTALGLSAQITGDIVLGGDGVEASLLNSVGVTVELQMSEHHNTGEEESGRVSLVLASDIWGSTMNGFKDGQVVGTNVSGWSDSETANKAGAEIRKNVSVEVWHDEYIELGWVLDHVEADGIEVHFPIVDLWVLLGGLPNAVDEKSIAHSHNVGLVHSGDGASLVVDGVLEGELGDLSAGLLGNELDTLDDAWNDLVLDTGVLALGVLSNGDQVDILVGGWEALEADAWSHVGVEAEGLSEHQVHTWVAGTDWRAEWALETALGDVHALFAWVRNFPLARSVLNGHHVSSLPVDWRAGGVEDLAHRIRNLWTDAITGDEGDELVLVSVDAGREGADGFAHHF